MRISIIIPIYNEEKTLLEILKRVENANVLGLEKEIILIDDGSTDKTKHILRRLEDKYKVIYHLKNQGKGAAIRTGFRNSTGDLILIQDADLEYDPCQYPKLIKPILENNADIVYGSRNLTKNPRFKKTYYWGVRIISFLTNIFYKSKLTDVYTCYKVFRAPIIKSISLENNGFGIEQEITSKLLKKGYKILEVPISYSPRSFKEGKKIKWKDGLIAIWLILKYKFR